MLVSSSFLYSKFPASKRGQTTSSRKNFKSPYDSPSYSSFSSSSASNFHTTNNNNNNNRRAPQRSTFIYNNSRITSKVITSGSGSSVLVRGNSSSTSDKDSDQVSKTLAEIENLLKNITDKRHQQGQGQPQQEQTTPVSASASGSGSAGSSGAKQVSETFGSWSSSITSSSGSDGQPFSQGAIPTSVDTDPNSLSNLKYLKNYPKTVRQWVLDAKTPKGRFNKFGEWETVPDTGDNLSKLAAQRIAQKAAEGDPSAAAKALPSDLEGHYRFGIKPDEIENCHPKIKELFSFKHANQREINQFRIKRAVETFRRKPEDTGNSAVQVAALTERINYLTEHMKKHPKDLSNQRGLMRLLENRRSMMKYLKRTNVPLYYQVLRKMGLRDMLA